MYKIRNMPFYSVRKYLKKKKTGLTVLSVNVLGHPWSLLTWCQTAIFHNLCSQTGPGRTSKDLNTWVTEEAGIAPPPPPPTPHFSTLDVCLYQSKKIPLLDIPRSCLPETNKKNSLGEIMIKVQHLKINYNGFDQPLNIKELFPLEIMDRAVNIWTENTQNLKQFI